MDKWVMGLMFVLASAVLSYRVLRALQMNGYRFSFNPLKPQAARIVIEYIILAVFFGISVALAKINGSLAATLSALIIIIIYGIVDAVRLRTPLKFTHRAIRLAAAVVAVLACLQLVSVLINNTALGITATGLSLIILTRVIALGVNYLITPLETLNNKRYVRLAKEKLGSLQAIKIGITGSYGKTSCKNILAEMLAVKYKVIKTEKNYNTPLGIARTAQRIEGDEEVFIAEMGARRKGDIKELTDIVKPKYAIITGVSPQHLATFKSEDRIYQTKRELVESLPSHGFAVFNGDNKYTQMMYESCPVRCSAVYTHHSESGIYADNIQLNNNGSNFTVKGLGEDLNLTTRLLGRHNIINILLCLTLAIELGVEKQALTEVVKGLKPVPHRLELLDTKGGVTVIDDSYNGNLEGVRFALEVLSLYPDKRKVVFTQGIVELGNKQAEINTLVGSMTAEVADIVILTGENASYIKSGLYNSGFPSDSVYIFKTFKEASDSLKTILRNNDILLIQNDIP